MSTNLAHAASHVISGASSLGALWSWCARASRSLASAMCGLNGHDPVLQVERGRLFLRCTSCGHESPGWTTSGRGPRPRFGGDHQRHRIN
jgi:hypothetical protein